MVSHCIVASTGSATEPAAGNVIDRWLIQFDGMHLSADVCQCLRMSADVCGRHSYLWMSAGDVCGQGKKEGLRWVSRCLRCLRGEKPPTSWGWMSAACLRTCSEDDSLLFSNVCGVFESYRFLLSFATCDNAQDFLFRPCFGLNNNIPFGTCMFDMVSV